MNKKVLVGCYEIPGYGGASTAGYTLFEMMKDDGFDIHYMNLIDEQDMDYYGYMFGQHCGNPKTLANVYNFVLKGDLFSLHPELDLLIHNLKPDILIGIGWIATLLMKRAASKQPLIFLTTGCDQVKSFIATRKTRDMIALGESIHREKGLPKLFHVHEKEAVEISNLIVTHSDMILFLYQYFFPFQIGKIYPDAIWFAEWIYNDASSYSCFQKPFKERDIDILFISSNWSRPEKNYELVKKIISRFNGSRVHIVGEVEKKIAHAKYHGLIISRSDVFALMGRSKTVISPSLFDAAPGILFEASAMGCNIVASKNCGNWLICNENLLVDPFRLDNFFDNIQLSLTKKFNDNIDIFLQTNSYENLVETIKVF